MAAGVIFMQWESYVGETDGHSFFAEEPLTFNSRQERLHQLGAGDRLCLVLGVTSQDARRPIIPQIASQASVR
jgi:hypothetical protein